MNETKFLEMADRERDAWIDEFIMGFDLYCSRNKKGSFLFAHRRNIAEGDQTVVPDYDDYNAMHRVMDQMDELGWRWEASFDGSAYYFKFVAGFSEQDTGWIHADDLKTAVYLAAGRAKGVIDG